MSLYQSNAFFREIVFSGQLPPLVGSELHPAKQVLKGPVTSGGGVISRNECRHVIFPPSLLKIIPRIAHFFRVYNIIAIILDHNLNEKVYMLGKATRKICKNILQKKVNAFLVHN